MTALPRRYQAIDFSNGSGIEDSRRCFIGAIGIRLDSRHGAMNAAKTHATGTGAIGSGRNVRRRSSSILFRFDDKDFQKVAPNETVQGIQLRVIIFESQSSRIILGNGQHGLRRSR